jgi:hypothetical protein
MCGEDLFSFEIASWRVMLVEGLHGHPIRRRPRGRGQRLTPDVVSPIGNTDPIHGTKNDRLSTPQQHNSSSAEGVNDLLRRRDRAIAKGTA